MPERVFPERVNLIKGGKLIMKGWQAPFHRLETQM
jgi:hypothetical protein